MPWAKSFEQAAEQAKFLHQPFALLLTTRDLVETAGEGPAVFKEYEEANGHLPRMTIADHPPGIEPIMAAGLRIFVKLADTNANTAIFKKYGEKPTTIVFIAPDGEKLVAYEGADCSPEKIYKLLDKFKEKFAKWKKKHGVEASDTKAKD